ncbi:hypothetical protein BKA70DRAFT_1394631 [Coprinopsis sp. MPI-PUGE-AT-0042]|nr:hypothetical protein BKA70DRAFT_1394631 [Coprinopsis sp. MPI-PUGE-AT-0042]
MEKLVVHPFLLHSGAKVRLVDNALIEHRYLSMLFLQIYAVICGPQVVNLSTKPREEEEEEEEPQGLRLSFTLPSETDFAASGEIIWGSIPFEYGRPTFTLGITAGSAKAMKKFRVDVDMVCNETENSHFEGHEAAERPLVTAQRLAVVRVRIPWQIQIEHYVSGTIISTARSNPRAFSLRFCNQLGGTSYTGPAIAFLPASFLHAPTTPPAQAFPSSTGKYLIALARGLNSDSMTLSSLNNGSWPIPTAMTEDRIMYSTTSAAGKHADNSDEPGTVPIHIGVRLELTIARN